MQPSFSTVSCPSLPKLVSFAKSYLNLKFFQIWNKFTKFKIYPSWNSFGLLEFVVRIIHLGKFSGLISSDIVSFSLFFSFWNSDQRHVTFSLSSMSFNLSFMCYISLPLCASFQTSYSGLSSISTILSFFLLFFWPGYFIFLVYFWLRWVFVAACRFSLVAASRGYSSLRCTSFSLRWLLLLQSSGSRCAGFSSCGTWASVVVVHGLSCSAACGIFLDQGSNLCPLHWQADS